MQEMNRKLRVRFSDIDDLEDYAYKMLPPLGYLIWRFMHLSTLVCSSFFRNIQVADKECACTLIVRKDMDEKLTITYIQYKQDEVR